MLADGRKCFWVPSSRHADEVYTKCGVRAKFWKYILHASFGRRREALRAASSNNRYWIPTRFFFFHVFFFLVQGSIRFSQALTFSRVCDVTNLLDQHCLYFFMSTPFFVEI